MALILMKMKPINQLPSNIREQLRRIGDFYICTQFSKDLIGDPMVKIGKDVYYRYMNFLYLPKPPESLTTEQIIEVCDVRIEYFNEIVDQKYNRQMIANIINCLSPNLISVDAPIKVLDFGCGTGLSSKLLSEYLSNLQIVGVDISEKAILECCQQDLTAFLIHPEEPLPFEDYSFDMIFAIFVMHFKLGISTLIELQRVLRTS